MSARSVRAALDPEKYEVVMIGITRGGRWITGDVAAALESGMPEMASMAALLPDPESSELMELEMFESQPSRLSSHDSNQSHP